MDTSKGTETRAYAARLRGAEALWKRALGVQRIYAWNLRRLEPGFMLDVGCGIGRNLRAVHGHGVGVDHNPYSVARARELGFEAYTSDEFKDSPHARPARFDSMLVSHVLEHMDEEEAQALVASYLPYVRPGGKLISITPQERGFRSDPTHRQFMGFEEVERVARRLRLEPVLRRSFPFPRPVGRVFTHNEFVVVAHKAP